jgi:hypothetical protein
VRRTLALFVTQVGLLVATVTLSGWWWRHTTLDPSRTGRVAESLMESPQIRSLIVDRIVDEAAAATGRSPDELRAIADQRLDGSDPNAKVSLPAVADALKQVHERLVGVSSGPVTLSPAAISELLGPELAAQIPLSSVPTIDPNAALEAARANADSAFADSGLADSAFGDAISAQPGLADQLGNLNPLAPSSAPAANATPLSWDVPQLGWMASARDRLDDLIALGVVVALGLVAAGLLLHPRPEQTLRTVGWWSLGAAAWQLTIAWVLPVVVLPKLTDNPWIAIASGVTKASTMGLIGVLVALVGAGAIAIVASIVIGGARETWAARPMPAAAGPAGLHPQSPATSTQPSVQAPAESPWRPARFSNTHRRSSTGKDATGGWRL